MAYKPKKGNRWYDSHADISKAIDLFKELPPPLRMIVAKGVVQFVQENQLLGTPDELKSFGHQRVLGLIQSKAKRRWYDKDPMLHKAINNILMMTDNDRKESAFRLVISLESVEAYKETCLKHDALYEVDDIEQIVSEVFSRDYDELMELTSLPEDERGQFFLKKFPQPMSDSEVLDEDSGMKLSATMFEKNDQ